jgi:putative Ca2+/H+ antiporter (TMEM165/GDT1 family)
MDGNLDQSLPKGMEIWLNYSMWKLFLVVFWTVFLAELGDKTQLATFLFATQNPLHKYLVFSGAFSALALSTLLVVLLGGKLAELLPLKVIRILSGLGFIGIGIFILLRESNGFRSLFP